MYNTSARARVSSPLSHITALGALHIQHGTTEEVVCGASCLFRGPWQEPGEPSRRAAAIGLYSSLAAVSDMDTVRVAGFKSVVLPRTYGPAAFPV
jgi:hypothetical protein